MHRPTFLPLCVIEGWEQEALGALQVLCVLRWSDA